MPRARKGSARHRKHKRVLKSVSGHHGAEGVRYSLAITALLRAGQHAYRNRRVRKRDFRGLWITRISAACRQRGVRYGEFINRLKIAGIALNRKMLSEIAVADPEMFDKLANVTDSAA
ncbi:MAG: 50S ribosomal protein L20 [Planctomycetes bacterium]|nr:50S ribosomal protein L20 [Planctomycetota bacterium]